MYIEAPGGDMTWPANEGTIGVVGTSPPLALDFTRRLLSMVPARETWQWPHLLVDHNGKIPNVVRHMEQAEADPSSFILESIQELADQGATVVVVPSSAAHLLYDRWSYDAPVPLPHMWRNAIKAAMGDRVAVLESSFVRNTHAYPSMLEDAGRVLIDTSDLIPTVDALIDSVKHHGNLRVIERNAFAQTIEQIRGLGAQSVIVGDSALCALAEVVDVDGIQIVDAVQELARAALHEAHVITLAEDPTARAIANAVLQPV